MRQIGRAVPIIEYIFIINNELSLYSLWLIAFQPLTSDAML